MDEWRSRAYAKINLSLDVLGRREDGYHEIRTVMQTIGIFDNVVLRKTEEPGIVLTTDKDYLPTDGRNLMVRAAALLFEAFGLPGGLRMELSKFIPVAAGLAGGSTDAAAVLRGINELYGLGLSAGALAAEGLKLGADVPYCLSGKTMLAEGIGEKLSELKPCPDCSILVSKPRFSVSTKTVYEAFDRVDSVAHPDTDGLIAALERGDLKSMAVCMGNVLERVTGTLHPAIAEIEASMARNGALKAMMSGSGPTVFGIFDDPEKAVFARQAMRRERRCGTVYLCEPVQGV
ncbi:MAG: 4-(cytidine 5'-diphospho)-2-C-methyl-D-erythritol kinase [Lachnospiraceae bacterium]|nr:4-(cytidine 5'-diphospho)-2-C-methyl-D-erythritol kinase [Lachnospiraceae bacterium]